MASVEKFQKEIEDLVRYVKDSMKSEDDWVVIKYRDVPKITGISSYYVRNIFELLKVHKNIIFEIDKEAKTHKKPLKFRYVNKDEKLKSGITGKNFYYLSQDEVDFIKKQLGTKDYSDLYKAVNLCNYLASIDAKEKFVPLDVKDIVNITVSSEKEVMKYVNMLTKYNLLIDKEGLVKLILTSDELEKFISDMNQQAPSSRDYPHLDRDKILNKLLEKQGVANESIVDELDELDESNSLVDNMRSFRNSIAIMQDEFRVFLDKEIERVSESEKKEEEINQGFETLQKLMDENKRLSDTNEQLARERDQLVNSLQVAQKFRDHFIENAEQRLEILLAEIIGVVSSYAQTPAWQKNQASNAKLQKNILNAVTSAVDDMLRYTKD